MSLTIQERIKDLRVERGLTLKELAAETGLSSSALGSYETDETKDISHYALIKLAKFYGVTADYLLGLSEMKSHSNADLADLRLSDNMIDILKSDRIDNALPSSSSASALLTAVCWSSGQTQSDPVSSPATRPCLWQT